MISEKRSTHVLDPLQWKRSYRRSSLILHPLGFVSFRLLHFRVSWAGPVFATAVFSSHLFNGLWSLSTWMHQKQTDGLFQAHREFGVRSSHSFAAAWWRRPWRSRRPRRATTFAGAWLNLPPIKLRRVECSHGTSASVQVEVQSEKSFLTFGHLVCTSRFTSTSLNFSWIWLPLPLVSA